METTIRDARKAAGFTQLQLGQRIGVSQGYVSFLENGLRPKASRVREAIADALNVPVADLFPDN